MKLLIKTLEKRFEQIGSQENNSDPLVIARFFNPAGAGTWYATEYDPKTQLFFGYVSIFRDDCDELGYFSLNELESIKSPLQINIGGTQYSYPACIGIERDLHFREKTLSECLKDDGIKKSF